MEKSSFFVDLCFRLRCICRGKRFCFRRHLQKPCRQKNLMWQICLCICRRCSSWITFLSVCLQLLLCRRIGLPTFTDLRLRLLWVRCFPKVRGMSLQGNASSTRILLVVTHGALCPRQPFGQVDAVNFGNEADFLRLLGNAYAAFYRIGQRRTAWNGHNCANALYQKAFLCYNKCK